VKPNIENIVKPDTNSKVAPVEIKTEAAVPAPIGITKTEAKVEKKDANPAKPQIKPPTSSIFKDIASNPRPLDNVKAMQFSQGHLQEFAPKILVIPCSPRIQIFIQN
jgi:hypothetical protein